MKKKLQIFLITISVVIGLLISNATIFGDTLEYNKEEIVSVLVYLKDQVDLKTIDSEMDEIGASLKDRHETIVVALQNTAYSTQPELIHYLEELQIQELVIDFKSFWIANIFRIDTYQSVVDQIAMRDDVFFVYPNYEIEFNEPVDKSYDSDNNRGSIEQGVIAIRASEVWEEFNITGKGILVATIDTGVDGNHPALASRWAGVADPRYVGHPEWAWFDPYAGQNDFPYDLNGHGTHTMGSVCGGAPGDHIGVAPGALWMSAGAINRGGGIPQTVADAIESFEWMIDPDGNPETNWDVPAVCSNSWGLSTSHGYPPCDETFWSFLDACEAAGTVIIFSAGSEGPSPETICRPADRATDDYRTFAVGAVDANNPSWPIASFSSRGPSYCTPDGSEAIKPEIVAPGVNVRSSIPGGDYSYYSGTSMATPHINGVVALMREANPDLEVDEIKEIIYQTAYDLGDEGEDNDYGWGMVDAYEAVLQAIMLNNLPPEDPEKPSGESEGLTKVEYTFSSSSTDPEEQQIFYMFDWGDNTTSDWLGPYDSGVAVNANHSWNDPGDFEIKVKAKDINDSTSQWSEPHLIHITKGPYIDVQKINGGLFTIDVLIRNLGEIQAKNVSWYIELEGGIILLGRKTTGLISCIQPANEHIVKSRPIFGFGEVIVTAKAEITGNTGEKKNSGFVYIFYIKVNSGNGF